MASATPVHVRILHVAECARLDHARALVDAALAETGVAATVEEVEGEYASPTVTVEGIDVTGQPPPPRGPSCRLDLPSPQQITAALTAAARGR